MDKHSLPSIEKFAAFLDGNLPQDEMQQFSQMAELDSVLHQLLNASEVVDNTLAGFIDADMQLPEEIVNSSFDIPTIPTDEMTHYAPLMPDLANESLIMANCSDDDVLSCSSDLQNMHSINSDGELANQLTDHVEITANPDIE